MASIPVDGRLRAGRSKLTSVDLPASAVTDSSADATSPVVAASSPRNRALRDWCSVEDYSPSATDSTTAFQNAVNSGKKIILLQGGKTYKAQAIVPSSHTTFWGEGATMQLPAAAIPNYGIFVVQSQYGKGVDGTTGINLHGITFAGSGTESTNQTVVIFERCSKITIEYCDVSNWATGVFYLLDSSIIRVLHNNLDTCGVSLGTNAINLVSSSNGATYPLTDLLVLGNTATNIITVPIDIVVNSAASTTPLRARIIGNHAHSNGTGHGISIEATFTGASAQDVLIVGNIARYTGGLAGHYAIACTSNGQAQNVVITGNRVTSTNGLILNDSVGGITRGNPGVADTYWPVTACPYGPDLTAAIDLRLFTTTATISANSAFGTRVVIPKTGTLDAIYAYFGVQSGNCDVGVYNSTSSGTYSKLWSSGSQVVPAAGSWQSLGNPSLAVTAGEVIDLVMAVDNATVSYACSATTTGSAIALPSGVFGASGFAPKLSWFQSTSFPLPSTISPANNRGQVPALMAHIT